MTDQNEPYDPDKDPNIIKKENVTGFNANYLATKKKRDLLYPPKETENILMLKRGDLAPKGVDQSILDLIPENTTLEISEAALTELSKFANKMAHGYQASVPIICLGSDKCPYAASCPLIKANIALPLLEDCPVERSLFNKWVQNKMTELDVDPNDELASVDMSQIMEYAQLEIIQMRANLEMSMIPSVVTDKVIGFDSKGMPIMTTEMNPRIAVIEKLGTAKNRILDDLVATRKSRLKNGGGPKNQVDIMQDLVSKMVKEKHNARELRRLDKKDGVKTVEVKVIKEEPVVEPPKGMEHYGKQTPK